LADVEIPREDAIPAMRPARVTFLVWLAIVGVGGAVAVAALAAAIVAGAGWPGPAAAAWAAGLSAMIGTGCAAVILRFDLYPTLLRLADARTRGGDAWNAQAEATVRKLLRYPDRFERWLGVYVLFSLLTGFLVTGWWIGAALPFFYRFLVPGMLAALLIVRACRAATHRTLRPVLAQLPGPRAPEAFSGSFARRVADLIVIPVALALFFAVLAEDLQSERTREETWLGRHEAVATRIASSEAARNAVAAAPSRPAGPAGIARVACNPEPAGESGRACRGVRRGGGSPATTSWVDRGTRRAYAAAPTPDGGVVLLAFAPPRMRSGPSWSLVLMAAFLLAAHLYGSAVGSRAARALRRIAASLERIDSGTPVDAHADPPSRVRELDRIEAVLPALAARIRDVRRTQEQATESLAASRRMKTQFLASMSHDLKGPLNSILGFSELLLRGMEGPLLPQQRQDVDLIYRAGEDLLRIINGILDSAKLEVGRIELAREWVPSVELVANAVRHARSLVGDKEITVQSEVQPGLPPVHVDPHRMAQALECVVSNAVKFTERGFVAVRARVETPPGRPGRSLRIDVLDQGPGIPAGYRDSLFLPFHQLDGSSSRRAGGTGLGLFIARSLVELHGGRISFESNIGRGTVFSISLPLEGSGDQNEGGRT